MVLVCLGLVFLHSSTANSDNHRAGLLVRQLKSLALALPVLLVLSFLRSRLLARSAYLFYSLALLALILVLVFGVEFNHARRWFRAPGGFLVQPSELAKVAYILAMARYLEFRGRPERLSQWIGPALLTMVPFVLIRAQPDLGTALMYLPMGAAMLYVAGARVRHFAGGLAMLVILVPAVYFSPMLQDYQKERIRTFLTSVPQLSSRAQEARTSGDFERAQNLEKELLRLKRNAGYQGHASQIAIGSGGWTGKGLGQGPQNHLNYVPERHCDFAFAVIGEEWGLWGGALVILLYLLLAWAILAVGATVRDVFGQLVCVGVATSLAGQAFLNIGMCAGLLPITGMPLPLISQGGSSLLTTLALLGLVVTVGRHRHSTEPFLYRTEKSRDPFGARGLAPLGDRRATAPRH